ncbi:kinase-like domain-containing protein [Exophiala viscosa]|uniref:Kinase-like domain-containing protein n=1 Tax=Exophiala viscosa TaxID=2486360 RepID=A0AAN6IGG9_9EURO|nr:kinase-like domain-containing protein [Exophiala viscosa]
MASSIPLRRTKGVVLLLAGSAALLVYLAYRSTLTSKSKQFSSSTGTTDESPAHESAKREQSPIQAGSTPEIHIGVDGDPKAVATHKNEDEQEDGNEENEDEESDCDDFEKFRPIMAAIDLDKVKHAALEMRAQQRPYHNADREGDVNGALDCTIAEELHRGSFNLVYVVQWSDGLKWILRVPGHGLEFDANDVTRMNTEYRTMEYIRQHTTIPIPQVFSWEINCESIGVPFAFMSFVEGEPLYRVWYDKDKFSDDARSKLLSDLAAYMSQLHKLEFPAMGMLQFQDPLAQPTVGPIYAREVEFFQDGWGKHHVEGPYTSISDHLLILLSRCEHRSKMSQSEEPLFKMIIESIPKYLDGNGRFYLSPADFNVQNVMVNAAGEIKGIIDWDNVTTKPAAFGYARYPLWLTRDWDPCSCVFNCEDDECTESKPQEFLRYRQHYAAAFAACSPKDYDPMMTKASHILGAICMALESEIMRDGLLHQIMAFAFGGKPPFLLSDYVKSYVADDTADKDKLLKVAFSRMWQEYGEWEEAEERTCQFLREEFG